MSFTVANPFNRSPRTPNTQPANVELPAFQNPDQIRVLPHDVGAGRLAQRAVSLFGETILKDAFGENPEIAHNRSVELAVDVEALGENTVARLEQSSEYDEINGGVEGLWRDKALKGDAAMVTLMSINRLANDRSQGFYATRAADMLNGIQPDDTHITLE